jgi:hypothetical protein
LLARQGCEAERARTSLLAAELDIVMNSANVHPDDSGTSGAMRSPSRGMQSRKSMDQRLY